MSFKKVVYQRKRRGMLKALQSFGERKRIYESPIAAEEVALLVFRQVRKG